LSRFALLNQCAVEKIREALGLDHPSPHAGARKFASDLVELDDVEAADGLDQERMKCSMRVLDANHLIAACVADQPGVGSAWPRVHDTGR